MRHCVRFALAFMFSIGVFNPWPSLEAQALYDLLLKGGHVIDPLNNIDERRDLAIAQGKIAAVAADIPAARAAKVLDVTGLYVVPGLVDIHCHLYATTGLRGSWSGDNSVLPDGFSFRTGVTTMVDAGSSGWRNFEDFRYYVIDRAATRVLAMLNIVGLGMPTDIPEQNIHDMEPKVTAEMAKKHKDVVVGIKSAHYQGPEWVSVERAVEAGTLANIPVMVDFGYFLPERPFYELVTKKLRPGDMATHMYRAPVPYVDASGKLLRYLQVARERGVKFDVGHGGGSFVFRNAAPSIQQGFFPDSISTDLHTGSMNGGMMDMVTTMSKILALGAPLQEVVRESTINPARNIKHPELGHLSVGAVADVAVLNLMKGNFAFADASNGRLDASQRLLCELTLRAGKIVWDLNARGAVDYRKLGDRYGLRDVDHLVMPKP
jgi:dihydroorotase